MIDDYIVEYLQKKEQQIGKNMQFLAILIALRENETTGGRNRDRGKGLRE